MSQRAVSGEVARSIKCAMGSDRQMEPAEEQEENPGGAEDEYSNAGWHVGLSS